MLLKSCRKYKNLKAKKRNTADIIFHIFLFCQATIVVRIICGVALSLLPVLNKYVSIILSRKT